MTTRSFTWFCSLHILLCLSALAATPQTSDPTTKKAEPPPALAMHLAQICVNTPDTAAQPETPTIPLQKTPRTEAERIACIKHLPDQASDIEPPQHKSSPQIIEIYRTTPLPPPIATQAEVEHFQQQFNWFGIGFIVFVLASAWMISRM